MRTPKTPTPAPQTPKVTTHTSFAAAAGAMREQTPFGVALKAARLITSRTPSEEQPKEWAALQAAMNDLDDAGRHGVVSVLRREVLERNNPVQPLFAAARAAWVSWPNGRQGNLLSVARGTTVVRDAMSAGLTTDDMAEIGLAVLAPSGDKLDYRVNTEAIKAAVARLKTVPGKEAAQKVLADYLAKGEEIREGYTKLQARQGTIARLRATKTSGPATPAETQDTPDA